MWCGRKERSDGIARNERLGICLYRAEQRDTDDRKAPLAARPAKRLSTVCFAVKVIIRFYFLVLYDL